MKTFILIAVMCSDIACQDYPIDRSMTEQQCDVIYTDAFLQEKVDPFLERFEGNDSVYLKDLKCTEITEPNKTGLYVLLTVLFVFLAGAYPLLGAKK